MKASEYQTSKTPAELKTELLRLRKEQFNVAHAEGERPARISRTSCKELRRDIARVKTVLREKRDNG